MLAEWAKVLFVILLWQMKLGRGRVINFCATGITIIAMFGFPFCIICICTHIKIIGVKSEFSET